MNIDSTILVAGSETVLGAAMVRQLASRRFSRVIASPTDALLERGEVERTLERELPEYVFLTAGRSGGIEANRRYPADLIFNNLTVECNVIEGARKVRVRKLLYLASSCCYPKHAEQPMRVEELMTGKLEPTNEAYAVGKIAGIQLCQAYRAQYGCHCIVAIPANTFGPDDDFSPEESHVIGALIRRIHQAKQANEPFVDVWGSGTPRREFIYADDIADACLFLMDKYDEPAPINVGGGTDLTIGELARTISQIIGYRGEIRFDTSRPDGMPRKVLDSSPLLSMGWRPFTPFSIALRKTYDAYLAQENANVHRCCDVAG